MIKDIRLLLEKKTNIHRTKENQYISNKINNSFLTFHPIYVLFKTTTTTTRRTKIKRLAPDFIFSFQGNNVVANTPSLIDFFWLN
jgi:hypothetical protein